jgi:hypothetical protein
VEGILTRPTIILEIVLFTTKTFGEFIHHFIFGGDKSCMLASSGRCAEDCSVTSKKQVVEVIVDLQEEFYPQCCCKESMAEPVSCPIVLAMLTSRFCMFAMKWWQRRAPGWWRNFLERAGIARPLRNQLLPHRKIRMSGWQMRKGLVMSRMGLNQSN